MALDTSRELKDHTVAELRQMARERGIKRYSKMKKAELVRALQRTDTAGGDGHPVEDKTSYEPVVDWALQQDSQDQSAPAGRHDTTFEAEDQNAPAGRHDTTFDHDEIRAWANVRNAVPATDEGSGGVTLRFRFPQSPSESLRLIDWPTWFQTFDSLRLRFIYLVPADGSQTNDFELQNR